MHDDQTRTEWRAATARTAAERRDRDRDYHRMRAAAERAAAEAATDSAARAAHMQLAELYEAASCGGASPASEGG